jgi:hypothetical protein
MAVQKLTLSLFTRHALVIRIPILATVGKGRWAGSIASRHSSFGSRGPSCPSSSRASYTQTSCHMWCESIGSGLDKSALAQARPSRVNVPDGDRLDSRKKHFHSHPSFHLHYLYL